MGTVLKLMCTQPEFHLQSRLHRSDNLLKLEKHQTNLGLFCDFRTAAVIAFIFTEMINSSLLLLEVATG